MLNRSITFLLLLVAWLVFSGLYDAFHITLGVISCAFVTWISTDLLFEDECPGFRVRLAQAKRLAGYLLWLLWEVVLSNLHLLKLTLKPGGLGEVKPRITRYRTTLLKSDFEKYLLATSITITPGTITMKILGDDFYIHAVSATTAAGLDGQMERRIAAIFADSRSTPANPDPV